MRVVAFVLIADWPMMEEILVPVTRSRISKGFLAIPTYALSIFPSDRRQLRVRLDAQIVPLACLFVPPDTSAKEARLFGLAGWFRQINVRSGDFIGIELDPVTGEYTLTSETYRRWRRSEQIRDEALQSADIFEAVSALNELTIVRRSRPREVAIQELTRLCNEPSVERRRLSPRISTPRASVAPWIRTVLCTAYEGRCQICRFGFLRADGEFHFEIHHMNAELGDSPTNLLLLCPNCHAMLTFARIANVTYKDGWLVGMTINDRQVSVKQVALGKPIPMPDQIAVLFLVSAIHNVLNGSSR